MSKLETARQLVRQTLEQEKDSEMKFREHVQESLYILKKNQVVIFKQGKSGIQRLQQQGNSLDETLGRVQMSLAEISNNQMKWKNRFLLLLIVLGLFLLLDIIRMV